MRARGRRSRPGGGEVLVHLIHGDSAGGTLHLAGTPLENVLVQRDVLSTGPCHADPAVHHVLRRMHWSRHTWLHQPEDVRDLFASLAKDVLGAGELMKQLGHLPPRAVLVLWSTPTWSDQLQLWWTLDALERSGFDFRRVRLAGLRGPFAGYGLGSFPPARFRSALARTRPLTRARLHAGVALWRDFAAESPERFDAARRRGSRHLPALRSCGEEFGWNFPRPGPRNRLRLSEFDEALLRQLRRDEWSRATAVIGEIFGRTPFGRIGDEGVFHRYLDWARFRPAGNAVALGVLPGDRLLRNFRLRLTSEGERILRHGLETSWEAPPLWAGGTQVHGGATTWLKVARGSTWRLERN